jgi:hypothetical protein
MHIFKYEEQLNNLLPMKLEQLQCAAALNEHLSIANLIAMMDCDYSGWAGSRLLNHRRNP